MYVKRVPEVILKRESIHCRQKKKKNVMLGYPSKLVEDNIMLFGTV